MKKNRRPHRLIVTGLALFVFIHASRAEDRAGKLFLDKIYPVDEIRVTKDIQYATGAVTQPQKGDKPLFLDIYLPPADPKLPLKLPAVVFIHGGGFKNGNKQVGHVTPFNVGFSQHGYVTVSIQYRLIQDDPPLETGSSESTNLMQREINAATQDAANAVRWLRANAEKYHVDPNRIAIGGISAGAITSLFVAYEEADNLGSGAEVSAVLCHMGSLFGHENLIDANDPPAFIVHGTEDQLVPYSKAVEVEKRLKEVGVEHVFNTVKGQGHNLRYPHYADIIIDGKSIEQRCFEFFYEKLNLAELRPETPASNTVLER